MLENELDHLRPGTDDAPAARHTFVVGSTHCKSGEFLESFDFFRAQVEGPGVFHENLSGKSLPEGALDGTLLLQASRGSLATLPHLKCLLKAGFDPSVRNPEGSVSLLAAVHAVDQSPEAVEWLLLYRADPEAAGRIDRFNAYEKACRQGKAARLEALLAAHVADAALQQIRAMLDGADLARPMPTVYGKDANTRVRPVWADRLNDWEHKWARQYEGDRLFQIVQRGLIMREAPDGDLSRCLEVVAKCEWPPARFTYWTSSGCTHSCDCSCAPLFQTDMQKTSISTVDRNMKHRRNGIPKCL